ncbi:MAG TPA: Uma2 family endonuclease [Vicinamibacterales bacterium]|nr:Uma2 family endonuclease [Vicinamibacterales bacterium]
MLQPDLLFVSQKRSRIIQERIVGAPDMILEVLSPNPRIGLLEQRLELFAEYGVREIWLLHQIAKRFELRRTVDGRPVRRYAVDYQTPLTSDVLPDFHMCVGDILQD